MLYEVITASLERALAALRAYGANLANPAQLGACRSQLHQASGAVQIVGLEGASRFFEQTENLLSELESGVITSYSIHYTKLYESLRLISPGVA